jgi:IS6 family transposase
MTERGLGVHASCSWRWVEVFGPELYRAVDSAGQTIDFLLTAKRDAASAKRFFRKAFANPANVMFSPVSSTWIRTPRLRPRFRSSRTKACCGAVVVCVSVSTSTISWSRTIEPSNAAPGSRWAMARSAVLGECLQGIEAVNMIRKGRVRWVAKEDPAGQARFVGNLFGIAA